MTDRTDNFNRADSTISLGTPSDGGSAWVAENGTWGIVSNQGYRVATDLTTQNASLEASVSNVEVQVTLSERPRGGPIARVADASNRLIANLDNTSNNLILYKIVAAVATQLGSTYSVTPADGDVVKIRADSANLITVYLNGTSRITATDAAGSSNTKHGIACYRAGAGVSAYFDSFSITAIVAFVANQPRVISQAIQASNW